MQAGVVAASHAGVWDPAGKEFDHVVGSRLHIWHTPNGRTRHTEGTKRKWPVIKQYGEEQSSIQLKFCYNSYPLKQKGTQSTKTRPYHQLLEMLYDAAKHHRCMQALEPYLPPAGSSAAILRHAWSDSQPKDLANAHGPAPPSSSGLLISAASAASKSSSPPHASSSSSPPESPPSSTATAGFAEFEPAAL